MESAEGSLTPTWYAFGFGSYLCPRTTNLYIMQRQKKNREKLPWNFDMYGYKEGGEIETTSACFHRLGDAVFAIYLSIDQDQQVL